MRLLLDTNILIDFIRRQEPSGFSEPDMFDEAVGGGPFLFSVVSIWEVEIKSRLGKLNLVHPLAQWRHLAVASGGIMLDMTEDHILAKLDVEPNTKDPFDRLLLTTAAAEGALLVTRDRALQSHPLVWLPGLLVE
jgi:PIN domain nuclease of toxin-antitoxin system